MMESATVSIRVVSQGEALISVPSDIHIRLVPFPGNTSRPSLGDSIILTSWVFYSIPSGGRTIELPVTSSGWAYFCKVKSSRGNQSFCISIPEPGDYDLEDLVIDRPLPYWEEKA